MEINDEQIASIMAAAALSRFKDKLEGWQSPLDSMVLDAFKLHEADIRKSVYNAVGQVVKSESFQKALLDQLNHKLANLVINKCSGLVEKSFNNIMQDPILRTKLQTEVVKIIEGDTQP